jgi:hypothetical protein
MCFFQKERFRAILARGLIWPWLNVASALNAQDLIKISLFLAASSVSKMYHTLGARKLFPLLSTKYGPRKARRKLSREPHFNV